MQLHLHQTHHTIGDFEAIFTYLEDLIEQKRPGLHLFPELFLTGYPLADLCLQKIFIENYQDFLIKVKDLFQKSDLEGQNYLIGGLEYEFDHQGLPNKIKNVIFHFSSDSNESVYTKILLPNYDIFDEEKYYCPGEEAAYLEIEGQKVGLLICEDMWHSSMHEVDPVQLLKHKVDSEKIELDLVVNLSASPFNIHKQQKRIERAGSISKLFGAPFAYINKVGGEDEILFDGNSFLINEDQVLIKLESFKAQVQSVDLPKRNNSNVESLSEVENTWESLFEASIDDSNPPKLIPFSDEDCHELIKAIGFGIQEYAKKSGFKKFLVALSGGIDSSLVLTLLKLTLPKETPIEAIYMPSQFSSPESTQLSIDLCQNLNVQLRHFPIKFLHSTVKNAFVTELNEPLIGLADENIQSRLRGTILYARSNQTGAMVINTSNKSEIAVGYSTQYGDSVGAISALGDLYKSDVVRLCEYINQRFDNIIPERIITRPPSAELRENQEDSQSLPPYERLDAMLEGLLSYRLSTKELVQLGFDSQEVEKVFKLYTRSEYKRAQFCPIIKIDSKSFGFGYRVPINKKL